LTICAINVHDNLLASDDDDYYVDDDDGNVNVGYDNNPADN
jgi:hypothetical protein